MKFEPMLTPPSLSELRKNLNYTNVAYGGKNQCIVINSETGSVLPNCVGYAWGRFMEILGNTPSLCCGDAGTWYNYQYDEYKRGQKPQVGAVICWSRQGDYGHIAIVEQINKDGSITLSESGTSYPASSPIAIKTVFAPNYRCDWMQSYNPPYEFQGFIYNPKVSGYDNYFTDFVDVATKSINASKDTILKDLGAQQVKNWNSLFVYYCAKKAKITIAIPQKASATDFIKSTVNQYGGTFHDKTLFGLEMQYTPKPGDIICLVTSNKKPTEQYYADRVGIIYNISTTNYITTIYAIEGDVNGKVKEVTYDAKSNFVRGFLEFDWNRVSVSRTNTSYLRGEIYDEVNDADDALLREVAYVSKNQPLINVADMKLSVINYTSTLAQFFRQVGVLTNNYELDVPTSSVRFTNPMTYAGSDSPELRTNGSIIFNEFIRQGMTAAAAVGIMSYMWAESRWNPSAINLWENQPWEYRGRGLCQWSLGRAVAFVTAIPDWKTNITAQVRYCVNELKSSYKVLYNKIMDFPNTKTGAKQAAQKFTLTFGAGQPAEWELEKGIRAFYNHYGKANWLPHVEPAEYMWENNITTIMESELEPVNMNEVRKGKII